MALDRRRASPYGHPVDISTALEPTPIDLADRLGALADPVRLRIVGLLAVGGRCVCDLRVEMVIAANLLSYHLRVLREAGLVTATRRGRWIDYRLAPDGFAALWQQMSEAGVPLPGESIVEAMSGRLCELDEVEP
jgi:ArsR family transcriptional regulator